MTRLKSQSTEEIKKKKTKIYIASKRLTVD